MSSRQAPEPEAVQRWLVEPQPRLGCVNIHLGDSGWARMQIRTLIGYAADKEGNRCYTYSDWADILVEAQATSTSIATSA